MAKILVNATLIRISTAAVKAVSRMEAVKPTLYPHPVIDIGIFALCYQSHSDVIFKKGHL